MTPKLMQGERLLWQGRPAWRAVARDTLRLGWVAAYLGLLMIWDFAADRADGLGPVETLRGSLPIAVLGLAVLAGAAAYAVAVARTTAYTLTTERLILRHGVALGATVSIPLRLVAGVAVALRRDGTGDIPLALRPGARVRVLQLWPHVRPRRFGRSEPMLRGVPHAAALASLVSQTVAGVTPGVVHPLTAQGARRLGTATVSAA